MVLYRALRPCTPSSSTCSVLAYAAADVASNKAPVTQVISRFIRPLVVLNYEDRCGVRPPHIDDVLISWPIVHDIRNDPEEVTEKVMLDLLASQNLDFVVQLL